ncbi:DUF4652 domain-containing protein [Paenibacillus sp. FSL E2-0230]|uniref:DUF4652 domain-containing protein n=1 Tax=Paenibacillus sp. FSL E2-0230 TaxID=2954727 RepID=UPI0030D58D66
MYTNIKYDYDEKVIYVVKNGHEEVLDDDFPSEPKTSPSGDHVAFISPLEWECHGSLYLFDIKTGEKETLISPTEDHYIPKAVVWINEVLMGVIIGFGDGTPAVGGEVYTFDLRSKTLTQISKGTPDIQFLTLSVQGDRLKAEGIKYMDEDYLGFTDYAQEFILSDLG